MLARAETAHASTLAGASHALCSFRCHPALMLIQPGVCREDAGGRSARLRSGVVQQWIYNYRAKPDYAPCPRPPCVCCFIRRRSRNRRNAGNLSRLLSPGAIGSNPAKAEQLIASFFPVRPGRRMGDRPRHRPIRACLTGEKTFWRRGRTTALPGRQVMIRQLPRGASCRP